jgi:segregation and condensation protein A
MARITESLPEEGFLEFGACFDLEEGRLGVVVTFLALLELLRAQLIDLVQQGPYEPIYLRRIGAES